VIQRAEWNLSVRRDRELSNTASDARAVQVMGATPKSMANVMTFAVWRHNHFGSTRKNNSRAVIV
jgi:hypothetical protein